MTSGTPARVGAGSYALVCGISHLRDAAWKRGGLQSLQSMTVEQAQAVLDRVEQLEAALRRLEVSANTVARCYTHRPENFASALSALADDAEAARAALGVSP